MKGLFASDFKMALIFAEMSETERKKKANELDNRSYSSYTDEEKQFLDDLNESKVQMPGVTSGLKERGSMKTELSKKNLPKTGEL